MLLATAGSFPGDWAVQLTQLKKLSLVNISMSASNALNPTWGNAGSFPALQQLELTRIDGLMGPVPSTWKTGLPSLTALRIKEVPQIGATTNLSDWLELVNQAFRGVGANATSSTPSVPAGFELELASVNLTGVIPPAMFNNTRYNTER